MIYRVWLKIDSSTDNDLLKIEVRKYDYNTQYYHTLWSNEGELVDEKSFFIVSRKHNIYTEDENEIELINKLRVERSVLRNTLSENIKGKQLNINNLPANFIDRIMACINNIHGFKRANATCIKSVCLYKEADYDCRTDKQFIN